MTNNKRLTMVDIIYRESIIFILDIDNFFLCIVLIENNNILSSLGSKGNRIVLLYLNFFIISPKLQFFNNFTILIIKTQLVANRSDHILTYDRTLSDNCPACYSFCLQLNNKHSKLIIEFRHTDLDRLLLESIDENILLFSFLERNQKFKIHLFVNFPTILLIMLFKIYWK